MIKRHPKLLRVTLLALLNVIIFVLGCSFQAPPTTSAPNPFVPPPKSLPWEESHGQFYTRDLTRAQEEIPFPIVLPSYVPDKRKDAPPPGMTGPLRGFQDSNKVEVNIVYIVDLGDKVPGTFEISESNYPVLPPDPKLNPEVESIEIRGKRVVKEGNTDPVYFYFNQTGVYFVVIFRDFPIKEAVKVIESMIK